MLKLYRIVYPDGLFSNFRNVWFDNNTKIISDEGQKVLADPEEFKKVQLKLDELGCDVSEYHHTQICIDLA